MSSFAKRFNKQRKFDIDTTGFEYRKLENLYKENGANATYTIRAMYINTKSAFGDSPVIATDNYFVNLPVNMTKTAQEILNDDEAIAAIKAGKVGFTIHEYTQQKYNRVCYGINFVDFD